MFWDYCRSPLHGHSRKRGMFYLPLLSQNPVWTRVQTVHLRPRTLSLASCCQVKVSAQGKGIAPGNERYSKTYVNCSTAFSCSGTVYVNFGCNFIICSFKSLRASPSAAANSAMYIVMAIIVVWHKAIKQMKSFNILVLFAFSIFIFSTHVP